MTDRNSDMRHILSQVRTLTGGTVMEDVEQLMRKVSDDLGVTMELFDMSDAIVLADIQRDDGEPGSGKLALARLCNYADSVGKKITLSVLDDEPKLVRLYASLGFTVSEPEDEDQAGIYMARLPQ